MRFDCPHSQVPRVPVREAPYVRVAAILIAAFVVVSVWSRVTMPSAMAASAQTTATPQHAERPTGEAVPRGEAAEEEHGSGWLALIAKIVNFSILVFILTYYLRAPIAAYLASRSTQIRHALVTAAETRATASRQLEEIAARLKALPAELEALKARGAEEIAAERVRIEQAAEAERQRLLEQARREIEARWRIARRELLEHAAELAVQVASKRIRTSITPEDHARLVDRYAAQLSEAHR
jgi:F-type H+-transporting ATPase subunit b